MSMMYAKVDTIMKHSELPTKSKLSTSSLPEEDSDPFPYEDEEDSLDVSGQKRVTFNVGGVIFETLESSLTQPKRIVAKLLDHRFLERHWDEERREYFFDRDPVAFQAVLNYLRTGVLHLPHNMCSPQITAELIYWGLPRIDIEPCCWKDYSIGIQSLENLRKLEHDRQPAYTNPANLAHRPKPQNWHQRLKIRVWNVVSDPSSSRVAKVYTSISFGFVVTSVTVVCLNTVPFRHIAWDQHNSTTYKGKDIRSIHQPEDDLENFNTGAILYFHGHSLTKDNWHETLSLLDNVCLVFFTVEFLAALVTCPNKRTFFRSTLVILDILALMPDLLDRCIKLDASFYAEIISNESSEFLNVLGLLQLMRLCRVFRVLRRIPGMWIMLYTLHASMKELVLIMAILCVSTLFFASCMYYLDGSGQFSSVPVSCWWGITTLTTLGYGDMVPSTLSARVVGMACSIAGALMLSLTIPTLINNFLSMYHNIKYMVFKEEVFLKLHRNTELNETGFKVY